MDKSNKFIWANSFAVNEEVPKCPKDISEPAWAQLLYSPYCQVRPPMGFFHSSIRASTVV